MLSLKIYSGYKGSNHCSKKSTLPANTGYEFVQQCPELYILHNHQRKHFSA